MLLTDGNPNDTVALTVYETEILSVAATEGINLDQKLTLATEEISEVVLQFLLDHTRMVDPLPNQRRTIGVSDVVVSAQMTRWQALHTLALVYRDAFNNQLNDRYLAKWREYQALSKDGAVRTLSYGIGIVSNPIPEAPAPSLGTATGFGQGGTFYVQVTWVSRDRCGGCAESGHGFDCAGVEWPGGAGGESADSGDGIQRLHRDLREWRRHCRIRRRWRSAKRTRCRTRG